MAFANRSRALLAGTCLAFGLVAAPSVSAQDYLIGEIIKTPYNFCPRGMLAASGQILSIAQNTALFSLLGTTYGGNGQTTFALPDMRGRYSMKDGTGPGLSPRTQGERGGTETTTLTLSQMPLHAHTGVIRTTSAAGDSRRSFRAIFATTPANAYVQGTDPYSQLMNRETMIVRPTGNAQPFNNVPPYLAIQYCIVTEGIFPARS